MTTEIEPVEIEPSELAPTAPAWVRGLMEWVGRHTPGGIGGKLAASAGTFVLISFLVIVAVALPFVVGTEGALAIAAGSLAVFVLSAVVGGLGLLPIPGLGLVVMAMVFVLAAVYGPIPIGLAAVAGSTLGSFGMYALGSIGNEAMRRRLEGRPHAQRRMERVMAAARRHGVWLTFVTALVGLFNEWVCSAAGSAGVNFTGFAWAAALGHLIRLGLVAALGWLLLGSLV